MEEIKLIEQFPKELFEDTFNIVEVSKGKFAPMFLGDYVSIRVVDNTDRYYNMANKYELSDSLSETFSKEKALEIVLDRYKESCTDYNYLYEKLELPVAILNEEDIKINYLKQDLIKEEN